MERATDARTLAQESLREYVRPERLDGGNKWECSPGVRVDALKGLRFQSLPPLLTLHLKRCALLSAGRCARAQPRTPRRCRHTRRFVFDLNLLRRVKVSDPFSIPATMGLAEFLPEDRRSSGDAADGAAACLRAPAPTCAHPPRSARV